MCLIQISDEMYVGVVHNVYRTTRYLSHWIIEIRLCIDVKIVKFRLIFIEKMNYLCTIITNVFYSYGSKEKEPSNP